MLHEINAPMAPQIMTMKLHFISCVCALQSNLVSKEFRTQETKELSYPREHRFQRYNVCTQKISRNAMFSFDSKILGVCQTLNIKTKDKK